MSNSTVAAFIVAFLLFAWPARAQESRSSITGKVADAQGAMIPGAAVTVTNTETNFSARTTTNSTGYFEVSLLNPGIYSVAVEAPGFKRSVRTMLQLNVAGRLDLDFQLELGQVAESVEVTAAAPLLDTASASGGRVIDNRQLMQLPFGDLNPFGLSAMTPGMQPTGATDERRVFDKGGTSAFNTMGGVGQNEYTLDGAPVTGTNRRVGFAPSADAVAEFKIETATFDASYGHSSSATINVMTKAGTNAYHGSLFDQHRQQRWNATRHFERLAFEDSVRQGRRKADDQRQPAGRTNNFGGSLGGPVRLPKLYNGTDKLFFFVHYNGIYQRRVETSSSINRTVPKPGWRQGDFSDLLAIDATKYQVYDPRSAQRVDSRVVRTPFPGNRGVPVLNPLFKFYERLYPLPNNVPGLVSPEGTNNFLVVGLPQNWNFNMLVNRIDYNLSERHRVFGRWYWDHALENSNDWTRTTLPGLHSNGLTRINKGGGGNYIWTLSSRSVLDIAVSATRFNQGNEQPVQTSFKPTDVGLPAYLDTKAGPFQTLPQINIGGVEGIGAPYPVIDSRGTTGELKVSMFTVRGNHSLKYGWQERRYWFTSAGAGSSSGLFNFDRTYVRAADNNTTASDLGLGWAAFMMGVPTSANIDTNDSGYWSTRYRALYLHDDWRISSRLRLNLGLRYEREGGITERFNRGIGGGFLPDAKLPFTDLVQAAYARSPLAELAASQFQVLGGTEYLGAREKTFTNGTHKLLPRIGLVYELNPKTVLRGGYGWYYDTLNANNTRANQYGYSQPTSTPVSNDNGLTFCCGVGPAANIAGAVSPMLDPFPVRADGTRFDLPYGNRLGLLGLAGRGLTFTPRDFSPARQQRWRISVQRQIGTDIVIEVSYNGAQSKIPVTQPVSFLPLQYWATGNQRNQAVDDELNRNVTNPFNIGNLAPLQTSDPALYNYLRSQSFFTSSTIRKNQLLRSFPQMNGLNGLRPGISFGDSMGSNRYHDMQALFERRFSRGFHTAVMYTYSYGEVQDFYNNEFENSPSWRTNSLLRPHRFVWSAIYELPFGKGKKWAQRGVVQRLAGGWQLSWIYQYQSGPPTSWRNLFFYGDANQLGSLFQQEATHSKDIHVWFDPNIVYRGSGPVPAAFTGFDGRAASQPGVFHTRVFPTLLSELRADGFRNWDAKLQRRIAITEKLAVSLSADLLNVTNHTNFSAPNTDPTNRDFGRVTNQSGASRVLQLNLRVEF